MKTTTKTANIQSDSKTPIGGFEITKVVREFEPLFGDSLGGQTYGDLLDSLIEKALYDGAEIQDIRLHIEPETWAEMRLLHYQNERSKTAY